MYTWYPEDYLGKLKKFTTKNLERYLVLDPGKVYLALQPGVTRTSWCSHNITSYHRCQRYRFVIQASHVVDLWTPNPEITGSIPHVVSPVTSECAGTFCMACVTNHCQIWYLKNLFTLKCFKIYVLTVYISLLIFLNMALIIICSHHSWSALQQIVCCPWK